MQANSLTISIERLQEEIARVHEDEDLGSRSDLPEVYHAAEVARDTVRTSVDKLIDGWLDGNPDHPQYFVESYAWQQARLMRRNVDKWIVSFSLFPNHILK